MDARITPEGSLEILSRIEVAHLRDTGEGGLYELWRQCSLAILNSGAESDDVREIFGKNQDFRIAIVQQERGMELALKNAPESAFVDSQMIRGIREQLFSVVRDLIFINDEVLSSDRFDLSTSEGTTNAVFHILRTKPISAPSSEARARPDLIPPADFKSRPKTMFVSAWAARQT